MTEGAEPAPRYHGSMVNGRVAKRFEDHVVVGDGAMGSELLARLPHGAVVDLAPLEHPREILDIHLAYLRAGAEIIETATFAASRPRLGRLHAADLTEAVNAAGVKLAREAREVAGVDCLVAGSMGPLAGVLDIDDPAGRSAVAVAHAEQASILTGRGADLLVLETFFRLDELELAVDAIREVTGTPVVAMLTFAEPALADDAARHAATVRRLASRGLLAAGVNCSPGPAGTLDIVEAVGALPGVLAAMPNAGVLVRRDDRIFLPPATPSYLADFARRAVAAGAGLIGGCCGTGPDHIAAMAEAVRGLRPERPRRFAVSAPVTATGAPPEPVSPPSTLAARLAEGRFVRIVQIDPPKGTHAGRVLDACRRLAGGRHVDAVDVNSNPLARLRMDSLWLAAEIQRDAGLEAIPHITPRDTSLMGLQAQLLGAWAAGIRNLLAITGDPSQLGDYPGVHDVNHVDIFELVRAVTRMAEGVDCAGNRIGEPPAFLTGVAVNPAADDLSHEVDRLRRKVDAGARFVMSQVFFEWAPWERLLEAFGGRLPVPAVVGIWPLPSLKLALRLHHEVPGITVPDDLLRRLDEAGAGAADVGRERAEAMLRQAREYAQGVYVIAPFRNPEDVAPLLEIVAEPAP